VCVLLFDVLVLVRIVVAFIYCYDVLPWLVLLMSIVILCC
jgi:hypothetical protein